jgi:hypothetical protein
MMFLYHKYHNTLSRIRITINHTYLVLLVVAQKKRWLISMIILVPSSLFVVVVGKRMIGY